MIWSEFGTVVCEEKPLKTIQTVCSPQTGAGLTSAQSDRKKKSLTYFQCVTGVDLADYRRVYKWPVIDLQITTQKVCYYDD